MFSESVLQMPDVGKLCTSLPTPRLPQVNPESKSAGFLPPRLLQCLLPPECQPSSQHALGQLSSDCVLGGHSSICHPVPQASELCAQLSQPLCKQGRSLYKAPLAAGLDTSSVWCCKSMYHSQNQLAIRLFTATTHWPPTPQAWGPATQGKVSTKSSRLNPPLCCPHYRIGNVSPYLLPSRRRKLKRQIRER